jgi:hypothetical protein
MIAYIMVLVALLGLILHPEDGCSIFLRNVGKFIVDIDTASGYLNRVDVNNVRRYYLHFPTRTIIPSSGLFYCTVSRLTISRRMDD